MASLAAREPSPAGAGSAAFTQAAGPDSLGPDYPQAALRNEEQGSTTVRLTVGTNGRVTNCSVTSSSGSRSLDSATCRILQSRARFTPARDNRGNPTTDSVTQRIRWVLE